MPEPVLQDDRKGGATRHAALALIRDAGEIFIAYSRSDIRRARWLRRRFNKLRNAKPPESVFLDVESLEPAAGVDRDQVDARMRAADLVVVVCGRDTATKAEVNREIDLALALRRQEKLRILPVLLSSGVRLPDGIDYRIQGVPLIQLFPGLVWSRVGIAVVIAVLAGAAVFGLVERERKALVVRAESLVRSGEQLADDQPLLGLRLAVEALALVPESESEAQETVKRQALQIARRGRVAVLGTGVRRASLRAGLLFLERTGDSASLVRLADGRRLAQFEDLDEDCDLEIRGTYYGNLCDGELLTIGRLDDGSPIWVDPPEEAEREAERRDEDVISVSGWGMSDDAEESYLWADYRDLPGALYRSADASLITALADEVRGVDFSTDAEADRFVVRYTSPDVPDELRRTEDGGTVKQLAGKVHQVEFSPGEQASLVAVEYVDGRRELLRAVDGTPIPLGIGAQRILFGRQGEACFIVEYEDSSGRLHRIEDGLPVLVEEPRRVSFAETAYGRLALVEYLDGRREAWSCRSLQRIVPSGGVSGFQVSPGDGRYLVVYRDATTDLARSDDGTILANLGQDAAVLFSEDPETRHVIVTRGNRSELRRTVDGLVIADLPGRPDHVDWSRDGQGRYVLIEFENGEGKLYRTADGAPITELRPDEPGASFSDDPEASYMIVKYDSYPDELRRTVDGASLLDVGLESSLVMPRRPDGEVNFRDFLLQHDRRTNTSSLLHVPTREALRDSIESVVGISPDAEGSYFILGDDSGEVELWRAGERPRRLTGLGSNLAGHIFDMEGRRLVAWYPDGRAYLLDLEWLERLSDVTDDTTTAQIVDGLCGYLRASPFWNEALLQGRLEGEPSRGCQ